MGGGPTSTVDGFCDWPDFREGLVWIGFLPVDWQSRRSMQETFRRRGEGSRKHPDHHRSRTGCLPNLAGSRRRRTRVFVLFLTPSSPGEEFSLDQPTRFDRAIGKEFRAASGSARARFGFRCAIPCGFRLLCGNRVSKPRLNPEARSQPRCEPDAGNNPPSRQSRCCLPSGCDQGVVDGSQHAGRCSASEIQNAGHAVHLLIAVGFALFHSAPSHSHIMEIIEHK